MIIVLGNVTVQPDKVDAALALSHKHVTRSRTESGCISHAVHIDAENPHRLVFVEEWRDRTALESHFKVPASHAFVRTLRDLSVVPPQLAIYEATQVGA